MGTKGSSTPSTRAAMQGGVIDIKEDGDVNDTTSSPTLRQRLLGLLKAAKKPKATDTTSQPDADTADPKPAQPRNWPVKTYVNRRRDLVRGAYEERAAYLARTRTYPVIVPTSGFARTRYQAMRFIFTMVAVLVPLLKKSPRPYFPLPSIGQRRRTAIAQQRRVQLYATKVLSVFVIKGGLGKTTRALLRALSLKRDNPELTVLVQDVDNGTLIYRIIRTTILSMVDAVNNLTHIVSKPDLMRYCTKTAEGLYIMAYKRGDGTEGKRRNKRQPEEDGTPRTKRITREEMRGLIQMELGKVDIVINDLAPNEDDRNLGALDETDRVEIIMTPAKDSVMKALDTFEFLIDNGYEDLARTAMIVVNRRLPWTDLDKVYALFVDEFGSYMDNVKITSMDFSFRYAWGWDVLLSRLGRRNEVKLLEDNAATTVGLADSFIDEPSTQLTHSELEELRQQPLTRPVGGQSDPLPPLHPETEPTSESASNGKPSWPVNNSGEIVSPSSKLMEV